MQDENIVALYWERNEAAIEETKNKYESYLLKIAHNILVDFEDSQESVNDTYLALTSTVIFLNTKANLRCKNLKK